MGRLVGNMSTLIGVGIKGVAREGQQDGATQCELLSYEFG